MNKKVRFGTTLYPSTVNKIKEDKRHLDYDQLFSFYMSIAKMAESYENGEIKAELILLKWLHYGYDDLLEVGEDLKMSTLREVADVRYAIAKRLFEKHENDIIKRNKEFGKRSLNK